MALILTQYDFDNNLCGFHRHCLYNGLDCCETRVVHDVLAPRVAADEDAKRTYEFELATQAPAMVMMLRGVLLDKAARDVAIKDLEKEQLETETRLHEICEGFWDYVLQRKGKCPGGLPQPPITKTRFVLDAEGKKIRELDEDGKPIPRAFKKEEYTVEPGPYPAMGYHRFNGDETTCYRCGAGRWVPDGPNPRSPDQIKVLLYDKLHLPKQLNKKGKLSVDDEVLQRLIRKYDDERPVLEAIVECRRVRKQISLLKSPVDIDGRWHSSFNVGATEVDRWSSSQSAYRTGTNFQNIAERSRHVMIADPGLMMFYADLEQAESRVVAYDAEDEDYIAAHEGAYDVHTFVARACWPELPWTGDPKEDKAIAEQPTSFDPHHDYRLYAKKVQHGGNIGMSFHGVARELHIPEATARDAMERLAAAFPRRLARQQEIIAELRRTGQVRTFLGRKRQFFERLWDSATHREALAQTQQSTIAWLLNMALWRVWYNLDTMTHVGRAPKPSDPNKVWLLAQVHDAILGMVRVGDLETLREVKRLMEIPVPIRGRMMTVPVEILYGPRWSKHEMEKLT